MELKHYGDWQRSREVAAKRRKALADLLASGKPWRVADFAGIWQVKPVTIYKDLTILQKEAANAV